MSVHDRWRILAALTLARASMGFQFQSVAATAPVLAPQMGWTQADVGWLVGLYLLPGVAIALPGGVLGARFGDRRIAALGLAAMALGGLLNAFAPDVQTAAAGRLLSGAGGVLMNVVLTKMVADWFAGREIVLAMSVLINAWPIGIGLALLTLGSLATAYSPQAAFLATSVFALAGIALVLALYRPAPDAPAAPVIDLRALRPRDWQLIAVGALPWMFYNAGYAIVVAFLPTWFVGSGHTVAVAGSFTAINTLLIIVSVQAGGLLVQRFGRPNAIVTLGLVGWTVSLLAMMQSENPLPWLIAGGLLGGLPAGVLVSLPAQFLRPAIRSTGMGVFYTFFYAGTAVFPPIGGWAADRAGSASAPLHVAIAAIVATALALVATRRLQRSDP
jgi:MFS family permease